MGLSDSHSDNIHETNKLGSLAPFTCPECSGALWAVDRTLDERYKALQSLTAQEEGREQLSLARLYGDRTDEARQIREFLLKLSSANVHE